MAADARDELIELLHKARIKMLVEFYDVQDAAGVDAILANPDVVLRALGGVLAGGESITSPLHMTGDCWRFDTSERNYSNGS